MTKLWLIRHGEAHINQPRGDGLVSWVDEYGLTTAGIEQAELLAGRLVADPEINPNVIVASSYPRARQTAEIAGVALGLAVHLEDDLQEWRPGPDTQGLTLVEALASWERVRAGEGHDDRLSPGTETHNEFIERVDTTLVRLAGQQVGHEVLVFTHGGVIGRSFTTLMGVPHASTLNGLYAKHTSLTEWSLAEDINPPRWLLGRYNDATHLANRH
jgi:probable phosphoglycerate mutase